MSYRIGQGYDAHRFAPGRKFVLGGVVIPGERGLDGHSDADVLTHAIADAILGALGEGDIGRHFPPGDTKWKGADSVVLLKMVMEIAERRKARVVNVDSTLILEEPKIAPYAGEMKKRLGSALSIDPGLVSIKATSNEGLGSLGRGDGAAAHAVVLLEIVD